VAEQRTALRLGRVVWVVLADKNGNLKRRPALILTATSEIHAGEKIAVMAISTSYPEPPPPGYIELPWHSDRRRSPTGLPSRCAAVLHWVRFIEQDEIDELAGDVPPRIMIDIHARLREEAAE